MPSLSSSFIGSYGVLGVAVAVLLLDVIPFIGDAPACWRRSGLMPTR